MMGGMGNSTLSSADPHLLFLFRLTGGVSASWMWGGEVEFKVEGIRGTGGAAGRWRFVPNPAAGGEKFWEAAARYSCTFSSYKW